MFCGNCGTENANDAKFCKGCGKALGEVTNEQEVKKEVASPADSNEGKGTSGAAVNFDVGQIVEKIKALPKNILIGACAAVVALIVIICIAVNSGSTINLNKYVTIEATGYDGYGTVSATIDWTAIQEKYGKKIKFTNLENTEYASLLGYVTAVDVLQNCVSVKLEPSSGLSNGDKVTYTWDVDANVSTYLNCKVKYKEDTYKVSGLEKVGTFDAFADLDVTFEGVGPDGNASLNYTGTELSYSDFSCDKTSGLSNGDVVTVTINDDNLSYIAQNNGKLPETLEKEYTVEGLSSYVTKISEINDSAIAEMKNQATDVYNAYIAREWEDGETLQSLNYIGNYLLTSKSSDSYGDNNILYMVYKAQVRDVFSNENGAFDKVSDIYWYISFEDLKIDADGNLKIDVTEYDTPSASFTVDSGISSGWWSNQTWSYEGYETLDALYKDVVTSKLNTYNHEDNVDATATTETVTQ